MDATKTNAGAPAYSEDEEDDDRVGILFATLVICIIVGDHLRSQLTQGFQELPYAVRENLGLATAMAACGILSLPEWSAWIVMPFVVTSAGCIGGWASLSMVESVTERSEDYFGSDAATLGRRGFLMAFPALGLVAIAILR